MCAVVRGEGEWGLIDGDQKIGEVGACSKLYVIASAAVLDAASWTMLTYCGAI